MKKKYILLSSFLSLMALSSCENFLDRSPLDKFSEKAVWGNKDLIEANLADLYSRTPLSEFENPGLMHRMSYLGGECLKVNGPANWLEGTLSETGGQNESWDYGLIYDLNTFIIKITESPLEKKLIEVRQAEARFLRAFQYFEMVKRYGGIPLILKPQSITDSKEELYVKRNSEKEVYDFLSNECDELATVLPEVADGYGRVTKYAALALKSRAMLYAASVAQFGKPQLDGLLGFPASEAATYWQKSYDASKAIIESGQFALYNEKADKAENFQHLFLDEKNKETILAKVYNGKDKVGHRYDERCYPEFLARNIGGEVNPYLDVIEDFGYIDGRDGKSDIEYLTTHQVDFDEFFKDKDPRFTASVIYPGALFAGKPFYSHYGTYVDGKLTITTNVVGTYRGEPWRGRCTSSKARDTGFSIRKYVDELQYPQPLPGESDTDCLVYRYGEILLNMAEAAFELNRKDEALKYINMIRERAGVKAREQLTRELIRNERNVELAFEGHRYWDVRRWRTAVEELSKEKRGLEIYMDLSTEKYTVQLRKADLVTRGFVEKMYYLPINIGRISNNPNLAPENPGY